MTITSELAGKLERFIDMQRGDPSNDSLRHKCSEMATALGRFDVVTGLAESALAKNPADSAAHFDLATGLIGNRDFVAALEVLERLTGIVGQNVAIQSNMGLCHYCLGAFDRALPPLESCYRSGERSTGLVRLLVSTYHHLGQMDPAMKIAGENADIAVADGALAGVYALLYLDADDAAKAARWSQVALDLNPKSVDGRVTRATLATARMQLDEARALLEGVLKDVPNTGRAWIGLGALSLLERDLPAAQQRISRGLELMPTHIGSWHVLAWVHVLSGDLTAAEGAFQTALVGDRNFAESHGGLAVIAAMRGERARAEQLTKTALRLDPQCLSAKFAEAVLAGNADPARASSIIRSTAAEISGKDSSALSQLLARVLKH